MRSIVAATTAQNQRESVATTQAAAAETEARGEQRRVGVVRFQTLDGA